MKLLKIRNLSKDENVFIAKNVLTILDLFCRDKKMKTCHALTFSTLLQNRSYENGCEMSKNACARAKRAKLLFFVLVKHANL